MTAYAFTGAIAKVHDVRTNDDDNSNLGPTLTLGSPTSGSTLVLLASAANAPELAQTWDVDPTGWTFRTESLQDAAPMTGIWTKVSDGTETSVTLDSAYPATCTMLAAVELEPGWVFDAAASDDDLGSSPVSATTATLSAGGHLALTVTTCRSGRLVLDSASYDRHLVDSLYVVGQGGNGSIGVKDAGTGTTGFTAEANTASGARDKALSVAVFTLPATGGESKSTVGASSLVIAASGTVVKTEGATVPGTITDLVATPGDTEMVLTWTAPDDGGATITDYIVEYRVTP